MIVITNTSAACMTLSQMKTSLTLTLTRLPKVLIQNTPVKMTIKERWQLVREIVGPKLLLLALTIDISIVALIVWYVLS